MSKIYETAIIEKRNVLNELRSNNMTIQELRFFSIYLSKINPRDLSTRTVQFPIEDFQRIMGFGKLNLAQIRASTDSLLSKIVHVPDENGRGMRAFQLFKECHIFQDKYGRWVLEIDAHDKALPLMFDFKDRYFKYELWNALALKSANQLRMYEILKQYENIGKREITVEELRELLGIAKNEYSGRTGWSDFKKYVLDSCQAALRELTDICYTYERGRTGRGGKWHTIIFHIKKNKDYVDPLTLNEFIDLQPRNAANEYALSDGGVSEAARRSEKYREEYLVLYSEAVNDEFEKEELEQIALVLTRIDIPKDPNLSGAEAMMYGRQHYLKEKYAALNVETIRKSRLGEPPIRNRFRYFLSMLEEDVTQPLFVDQADWR